MNSAVHYSTLYPAGDKALLIYDLFWVLVIAGVIIWFIFLALQLYAVKGNPGPHPEKKTRWYVIGGGVLFPVVVISISIFLTLRPLPELVREGPPGTLTIHVSGLQWWWRVHYEIDGKMIETANEIWLPVNEAVNFRLKSEDVIHSFWIPSLAGKRDMIPGRETTLSFTPLKTGEFLGNCAEFCGASHALMRLHVRVVEKDQFEEWLAQEASPRMKSDHPGEKAFLTHGCASCHSVRGLTENGKIGPDLTHVGRRKRIGAGILLNNTHNLRRWVDHADKLKPEAKMPPFTSLPETERRLISDWLETLK